MAVLSKTRKHAENGGSSETKSELFQDVVEGSKTIRVDPLACIPYCKVRNMTEFGVRRLMSAFKDGGVLSGLTATGNLPTVVALSEQHEPLIKDHLMEDLMMSEGEAGETMTQHDTWYGIVDGAHRNEALRRLINEYTALFLGISWSVLLLTGSKMSYYL